MTKVLLVEDDMNLREIFEMRLQAEGLTTTVASDGEEALVVALKEKPDLIVADIMMPKMSGFEMLETLRASPDMAGVKVIMMTALGQAEDRARGEKLGVIKYLVKSQVTLEDFVRTVKEVLGGSPDATQPQPSEQKSELSNKQESEKKMDDNQQNNPAPAEPAGGGDMPAPDTSPPAGGDGGADDQMSSAQAQDAMNKQVDDAMGGAGAPAAGGDVGGGDAGGTQTDVPVSPPPADQAGSDEQPDEEQGGSQTTAPGGM